MYLTKNGYWQNLYRNWNIANTEPIHLLSVFFLQTAIHFHLPLQLRRREALCGNAYQSLSACACEKWPESGMFSHILARTHTHMHASLHACTHAHACTRTQARTYLQTGLPCTLTRMHCTRRWKHVHIYTTQLNLIHSYSFKRLCFLYWCVFTLSGMPCMYCAKSARRRTCLRTGKHTRAFAAAFDSIWKLKRMHNQKYGAHKQISCVLFVFTWVSVCVHV